MSVIRKFVVSTVVEVVDPATDEERALDDQPIAALIQAAGIAETKRLLDRWSAGEREYLVVSLAEVGSGESVEPLVGSLGLTATALDAIVAEIRETLWPDADPNEEWSNDTIVYVAEVLIAAGLNPQGTA